MAINSGGGCSLPFYLLYFALLDLSCTCVFFFAKISFRFRSFFSYLVSLFSPFLFVMPSFEKVKDVHGWLVDRKAFEPRAIRSKVSYSG